MSSTSFSISVNKINAVTLNICCIKSLIVIKILPTLYNMIEQDTTRWSNDLNFLVLNKVVHCVKKCLTPLTGALDCSQIVQYCGLT